MRDDRIHIGDTKQRKLRIYSTNSSTNAGIKSRGITVCANDEVHAPHRKLAFGKVILWWIFTLDRPVLHVADDTHDLRQHCSGTPDLKAGLKRNALSNGIDIREI